MVYKALVDNTKIPLPLLRIKLRLIKNFIKAMNKEGEGLAYLNNKFHGINTKLKEGIFVRPQIRKIKIFVGPQFRKTLKHEGLTDILNLVENRA